MTDLFRDDNSENNSSHGIDDSCLSDGKNNVADIGLHRFGSTKRPRLPSIDDDICITFNPGEKDLESLRPLNDSNKSESSSEEKSTMTILCQKCCESWKNCFRPCQRKYHTPSDTLKGRLLNAILCPPAGNLALVLLFLLVVLVAWGVIWSLTEDDALPGGYLFALFILEIFCILGGKLVSLLCLPPLIGMLVVGFILRNVPYIDFAKDLRPEWSSAIRTIALAIILTRAGLGLDPSALRRLSCVCVRLAFLPCLAECITDAIISHFILGFPWFWGFMLGFVLAAVSPAVIVPSMLSIQEKHLGTAKGIPTLVIAAASIDDVLAIGGFGVVLGLTFSTGNLVMTIFHGPIEVLIGIAYGGIIGIMLWYLPNRKMENCTSYRFVLLLGLGLFALFGSRISGYAGSGALSCLILSFVAAYGWRKKSSESLADVAGYFSWLWVFFQPFLFGLIGAELDVNNLQGKSVGLGLTVLCCGLFIRIIVSSLAVLGANFTFKERLFVALAWLPKATVQAAIGPVALDFVRENVIGDYEESLGIQILTIAVLSILITAPVGAAAIAISSPKLLTKNDPNGSERNENMENAEIIIFNNVKTNEAGDQIGDNTKL